MVRASENKAGADLFTVVGYPPSGKVQIAIGIVGLLVSGLELEPTMSFSRRSRVPTQNGFLNYHNINFRSSSSSAFASDPNNNDNAEAITGANDHNSSRGVPGKHCQRLYTTTAETTDAPPSKRGRFSSSVSSRDHHGNYYQHPNPANRGSGNAPPTSSGSVLYTMESITAKDDAISHALANNKFFESTKFEEDADFMSRDEIERCSPSRKDGIDLISETHLRYSYCTFLQNLGMRLDLPQTTIGTAMVLCHRFFVRRSHACHDRFLIATAALFLAAKSEETPCPLNTVLRASSEICHKEDLAYLSYLLPVDWFEQYQERVTEAEQMILTTLDFELNVQHPYVPLTSVLNKLGLSQTILVNLALNLVNEGLRSSLWLQFKPHQIAAGAAFLAAKILNLDLAYFQTIWLEFQITPSVLHDVVQQLMELF